MEDGPLWKLFWFLQVCAPSASCNHHGKINESYVESQRGASSLTAPMVRCFSRGLPMITEQRWECQSKGEGQEPLQGELGEFEIAETLKTLNSPHCCMLPPTCLRNSWIII